MLILEKINNALENCRSYKNEKFILKEQNIKNNDRDLISKSLNIRGYKKTAYQDVFLKIDFLQLICHYF